MTNNGVGNVGNFSNVIYDSGHDMSTNKKRIGISATEVELLSDMPSSFGTGIPTSMNSVPDRVYVNDTQRSLSTDNQQQQQQSNYQPLSTQREQTNMNNVYQGGHDQQLNSAVNKLLNRYAPEANTQHVLNTTISHQQPPQTNFVTGRDESSFSTFQTGAPSSSIPTNNYSTVIRPNMGQIPQNQTQINNNYNTQPSNQSRQPSGYDSFQHVIPPSQQQQPQPQTSIPIKTTDGNITQVVPGKLYTLDDDPLHLLYDRQPTAPPNLQSFSQQRQPPPPAFPTTFQPSNNFQTLVDPLESMFTNTSQRYPQQPTSITIDPNSNGRQPLDLGNIIKRVQQDYLREIEPFVSSVKFIEKDRAYGQGLDNIGFSEPFSIHKGFSTQADDILRRSFGRQDDRHAPNSHYPTGPLNSKESYTSVSSTSTYGSDYDDRYPSQHNRKNKADVRDQATSPLPKLNQTRANPQLQKRISSDRRSTSSAGSETYDDENHSVTYNEHGRPSKSRSNPSQANNAMPTTTAQRSEDIHPAPPTLHSTQSNPDAPSHPRAQARKSVTEESGSGSGSELESGSEDEYTSTVASTQVTAPSSTQQIPPASGTARDAVAAAPNPTTNPRNAAAAAPNPPTNPRNAAAAAPNPPTNPRNAAAAAPNPPTNPRNAAAAAPNPTANARDAVAAAPNPPANPRNAAAAAPNPTANPRNAAAAAPNPTEARDAVAAAPNPPANPRNAAAAAPNPPANPRNAAAAATAPTTARDTVATTPHGAASTGNAAQTGSTRLFKSDGASKFTDRLKAAPASFGNKIRSLFSRKK